MEEVNSQWAELPAVWIILMREPSPIARPHFVDRTAEKDNWEVQPLPLWGAEM